MPELEFRLGEANGHFDQYEVYKFLVYHEKEALVMHTVPIPGIINSRIPHRKIIELYKLEEERVLGGGFIQFFQLAEGLTVQFSLASSEFGGVPRTVAERLGKLLEKHLKEKGRDVKEVEVDLSPVDSVDLYKWQDIGITP